MGIEQSGQCKEQRVKKALADAKKVTGSRCRECRVKLIARCLEKGMGQERIGHGVLNRTI